MCYDIKASLEAQLKRAERAGDLQAIEEIIVKLAPYSGLPLYHTTGFAHPRLLIYTDRSPYYPELATWGLVPDWVKDQSQLKKIWNNTINARGETIFEKPSFRTSAKNRRCIIYVDGFYEHHHFQKSVYPFYIHAKNKRPLALAGLWSEWADPETGELLITFTIVTTMGNRLLETIHNNPKLAGPRMPLILPNELEDAWLDTIDDEVDMKKIQTLIQPYPEDELAAHTVAKLRGKDYIGNVPEISEVFEYPELTS